MNNLSQLDKRLASLEQADSPENNIFQFPELRDLLKKYFEQGFDDEEAGMMAGQYYLNKYLSAGR